MYRIIVAAIVLTALFQSYARYRTGDLSRRRFIGMLVLWVAVLLFGFVPDLSDYIARFVGVGVGANLFFFFSILFLIYVMLGLYSRIEKLQRNLTTLVRSLALKDLDSHGGPSEERRARSEERG